MGDGVSAEDRRAPDGDNDADNERADQWAYAALCAFADHNGYRNHHGRRRIQGGSMSDKRRDYSRLWIFGHLMPYRTLYVQEEFVLADQSANWPHVTGWQEWKRVAWRIVFWRLPLSPWRRGAQPMWLSHPWVRNPPSSKAAA